MTQSSRPPAFLFKLANPIIKLLVGRNIAPISNVLMVIQHTGRRTGRQYLTPIGYARDGDSIVAFTLSRDTQWYQNIQHNPEVTLTIKGKPIRARAELVNDPDEAARVLDIYKRTQPTNYQRFFGVPLDMPSSEAARSPNLRATFVRFHLIR
jgi:deazaflavin-dependent oxidoreductase (nitroreductase family)